MVAANRDFVRKQPGATKRALRAILKRHPCKTTLDERRDVR
jgi:hypothetical protein